MGIESFFVCSLLILHGLGKSEESENRSRKLYLAACGASAAPAAWFKRRKPGKRR
jgi:hypothetical protein